MTRLIDTLADRCRFPNGHLHCAVSGGADSVAMLALAVHVAGPQSVTAWHIDHGLRPGSESEGELVSAFATKGGSAFESRRIHVESGPNLEARARAARYAALPDAVCTGHTADDVAESVLMNLMRGAGFDGMSPMQRTGSPRKGQVVSRPIIAMRRDETTALCSALGWTPLVDPMNTDARFVRSRVRHELLPLLTDIAGRDVALLLARSAEVASNDVEILDALAGELDPTDARALAVAPSNLARRALRRWFLETGVDPEGHPPTLAALDRALAVVRGEVTACEVGFGWRLLRSRQRLELRKSVTPNVF